MASKRVAREPMLPRVIALLVVFLFLAQHVDAGALFPPIYGYGLIKLVVLRCITKVETPLTVQYMRGSIDHNGDL